MLISPRCDILIWRTTGSAKHSEAVCDGEGYGRYLLSIESAQLSRNFRLIGKASS